MDYKRQLKEADSILHRVTGTHHNILSIGGDLFGRYEQICEEKLREAVRESEEKLLRQQTELREQAVAEAVRIGIYSRPTVNWVLGPQLAAHQLNFRWKYLDFSSKPMNISLAIVPYY